MGAGWAQRILKAFNKVDLPVCIFTIFTSGGIDFVGGYVLYKFLEQPIFENTKLGHVDLGELKEGEQIHEHVFQSGSMKVPVGWMEIMAYF